MSAAFTQIGSPLFGTITAYECPGAAETARGVDDPEEVDVPKVTKTPAQLESQRRYNASPKGRASRDKYAKTAKGQEALRKSKATWNAANGDVVLAASRARFARLLGRLNAIKLAAGCADCGYDTHPAALDFDHRDPETKVDNVSRLIRKRPWAEVEAEIAKCDVVCANCHRVRTYDRWQVVA